MLLLSEMSKQKDNKFSSGSSRVVGARTIRKHFEYSCRSGMKLNALFFWGKVAHD